MLVGVVVAVLAAVAIFAILGRGGGGPTYPSDAVFAQVQNNVTHVSPDTLAAVGTGGLSNPLTSASGGPPLLGPSSKPEVLYIGADYCPYCAGERWSLIVALSRLGSFSGLKPMASSGTDVYANTPTFTFDGAKYSSSYLDFVAVETETRDQKPLQTPTTEQNQVMARSDPQGSIPFVALGNRYTALGSGYQLDVLQGKDWLQISQALSDPNSPVARNVLGNANYLTAAICRITNGQPNQVCTTEPVASIKL